MTPQVLPRFTLRLRVPALALGAIALLGEPRPVPAQANAWQAQVTAEDGLAHALQQDAERLRQEAEAAKKVARRTASRMRWFLTLPAAGGSV